MIVTGPNANTSFVRNPFVKRKLAETRRYIYPLLPLAGDNFSSKVFVTGELIAFGYNLRWEILEPSVYGSSVSIVREDRKYIQDTVSGSTVFDPFEICGERKFRFEKFPPFEYSSWRILQSLSLPFDLRSFIHYTPLGAINFFVRITEIRSVKLVSSIANGPTKWPSKAFSYLIDSNRWSVGNRAEYREVLCRVPRSYRWFSRWFNAFRPIVNSALI